MANPSVITATYFISSGRKNAMYTLRVSRSGGAGMYASDNYICNLSTDPDKAEEKAREYFDRWVSRHGETEYFKPVFAGYADFGLFERKGKLSVRDTEMLELVESGVMPFGKNINKRFEDLSMNTVLWWADQSKEENITEKGEVFQAVCAACMGVALDKEYIAKREELRQERIDRDNLSEYVGELKQRLEFDGVIEAVADCGMQQVSYNGWIEKYMTKFRVGNDIVVYFGKRMGEPGEAIKFKATVKAHQEYKGVKQTVVNRPA